MNPLLRARATAATALDSWGQGLDLEEASTSVKDHEAQAVTE